MINRMTPIVTVCLLLVCFSPLWIIPPAAAQTIPGGYQLFTDPQGTAALLITQRPAKSATAALVQGLAEVAAAFDIKPNPLGGLRDVQRSNSRGEGLRPPCAGFPCRASPLRT